MATKGKKTVKNQAKAGRSREEVAARTARFIEAYISLDNAAAAARQAGYDAKASALMGHRLLKKPSVVEAITARRAELAKRFEVTSENTISVLANISFFDPIDFFDEAGNLRDMEMVPLRARQALAGFKVRRVIVKDAPDEDIIEVKFLDRGAQIEKLMRHLGLYDKDNRQKSDAVAELLAHIAANGSGLAVQPR